MQVKVLVSTPGLGHLHNRLLVDAAGLGNVEHGLEDDQAAVHVTCVVLHELERVVRMLFAHILVHVSVAAQVALYETETSEFNLIE
jgi:hypothetical protein